MTDRSFASAGTMHRASLPFRLIFSVSFIVHLFVGVAARLRPAFWRAPTHRSVLAEAREASVTIAQLAFAG